MPWLRACALLALATCTAAARLAALSSSLNHFGSVSDDGCEAFEVSKAERRLKGSVHGYARQSDCPVPWPQVHLSLTTEDAYAVQLAWRTRDGE
jgi:hypothetical protein